MIDIKSLNEIILSIINNIRTTSPDIDIKEGTFLRDAIINPVAEEISRLYGTIKEVDMSQSILTATGAALDKLAANYFIYRKSGSYSYGTVRFYLANTQIANYKYDFSFPDIYIPAGTQLATYGDTNNPSLQFVTNESVIIPGSSIKSLPRDSSGYQYKDIACRSAVVGENNNIGPNQIVTLLNISMNGIQMVTNLESFQNGSNEESDASLALRVGLAISGNNIGTKNGYLSYVLKQPQVIDAVVVGAGDPDMLRDKILVVDDGIITECKPGGCVDIYVRTNTESLHTVEYTVTDIEDNGTVKISTSILFDKLPVISIKSVLGSRGPTGDEELILYSTVDPSNKVSYNMEPTNKGLYYAGSIREKGYLLFDGYNVPQIGEKLVITYYYNNGITQLQNGIEQNKILTADVLIKSAQPIDTVLYLNTKCEPLCNLTQLESNVNSAIYNFINSNIRLGSTLDVTDILYLLKNIDGIVTVDINSIGFTTNSDKELVHYVRCNANQYVNLVKIVMNNTYSNE